MPPKPLNLGKTDAPNNIASAPVTTPSYVPPVTAAVQVPKVVSQTSNLPVVVLDMNTSGNRGVQTQTQIAAATSKITSIAKTSDMDALGDLLAQTLVAAKGYDPTQSSGKGILGFFKRKSEELRIKYERVDGTVQRLVGQIDQRIGTFTSRVTDLQQIADQNRAYHDALTGDIEYLSQGVAYMEANPPAVDPSDPFSAQKAQEWQSVIAWARKRADDLRRAQIVAQQQDAQINLMQQNSRALAQKFTDLKVTTLPLLQQTFSLYIINVEQAKGAEFANSIDDLSERTMQENAKKLGQNTVAIHTALNRSNFSLDAITANHKAVIDSLDAIDRIRAETKTRLASESTQLEKLSSDLSARLAQRA